MQQNGNIYNCKKYIKSGKILFAKMVYHVKIRNDECR